MSDQGLPDAIKEVRRRHRLVTKPAHAAVGLALGDSSAIVPAMPDTRTSRRRRPRPPVTEEQRRKVVEAIGRATLTHRELWEAIAAGQGPHEGDRWIASAVSHGYVRRRRSGNLRLYTVRPAGMPWVRNDLPSPPSITVNLSIPRDMSTAGVRALMADVIEDALSVRGWTA